VTFFKTFLPVFTAFFDIRLLSLFGLLFSLLLSLCPFIIDVSLKVDYKLHAFEIFLLPHNEQNS
jgi:hypothetical protein